MSANEIHLLVESNKRILDKLDGIEIRFDTVESDLVEVKRDLIEVKSDLVEVKSDLTEVKSNLNKVLAFVSVGNEDVIDKLAKSEMKKVSH
jgi:archaellum component FlaC